MCDRYGDRPQRCDASVVVKVLLAALDARRVEAGSEGVEPSARGVGDRSATTGSSPSEDDAHDVVRVMKVRTATRRRASSLPARIGPAIYRSFPIARLRFRMESLRGSARDRDE